MSWYVLPSDDDARRRSQVYVTLALLESCHFTPAPIVSGRGNVLVGIRGIRCRRV